MELSDLSAPGGNLEEYVYMSSMISTDVVFVLGLSQGLLGQSSGPVYPFVSTLRGLVYGIRSEVDEVTTATWISKITSWRTWRGFGIKLREERNTEAWHSMGQHGPTWAKPFKILQDHPKAG